ncbi:cAMP-binding domain of CRP or a regulatory subunit of cAMP-dependent protein kinases [Tistlia consotensis]|uniref:cAMP-binding domain of CRP or a regulatory subunit of cAMP-dependent protein kinases n=1 Tax=Tistlia consotensis USBA 355 TaxID=560819 RepID=A0A1Y6CP59_9PROT|nr:Crp/Fnr family transcriptional regulator [Tistlia consotensis]SMF78965.1 cAMP-binding domain of CRP or a regulatory subunit of cAMP-dependent protein kinases [Tistlia consotensis USBA 355]SNS15428.1 cAMP-binding domain of CRP or a regulatory subunit of cAMP-dependent protein kinases [Tistlia consotensis]
MPKDPRSHRLEGRLTVLHRKLSHFYAVSEAVERALVELCTREVRFERQQAIVEAGEAYQAVYLLAEGWVTRFKLLPTGDRQIINFALPGDFVCFNATLFSKADHFLTAKTPVRAYAIEKNPFGKLLALDPALAVALTWANAHEEALLAERLASLGRRTARERVAHLFCELWRRLHLIELTDNDRFPLPITQEDLADTLGLSAVHVNRTLRQLRNEGLIELGTNHVRVLSMRGLEQAAGFEDGYLHFTEVGQLR